MPKEVFSHYDTADYLKSPEQIAAYMEAAIAEGDGDPRFIAQALGVVARARNMAQLSRDTGLTREGLYKALSGAGNPSFDTVTKVSRALGLRITFCAEPRPGEKPASDVVGSGRKKRTRRSGLVGRARR